MDQKSKLPKKLPVTVLCGFLGSGKTTLLNYILSQAHGYKIAVLVNDMGEINVDSELIKQGDVSLRKSKERLVEMHNGCICCTLRTDLIKQITQISKSGKFDYMIIESTGIAEPLPIAQAFYFENDEMKKKGQMLKKYARLDTMVTLVDSVNFLTQLQSAQKNEQKNNSDNQNLSQLLLDQVEFANVIIVSKVDMVTEDTKNFIQSFIRKINPTAKILEAVKGVINLREIINTRLFNFEEAKSTSKWIEELQKPIHVSEIEEYGIQNVAFKARRPFHPYRLYDLLQLNEANPDSFWSKIIRSKGYLWIASKDKLGIELHKAGVQLTYQPGAFWWISIPKKQWGEKTEEINAVWDGLKELWFDNEIGDKRQEIVFIGQNLPKEQIISAFGAALLTEEEYSQFKQIGWEHEDDPFPKEWNRIIRDFQKTGEVREQDGEWEDVWDESGEMQEEELDI